MIRYTELSPEIRLICLNGECREWLVNCFYQSDFTTYTKVRAKAKRNAIEHMKSTGHIVQLSINRRTDMELS